MAQMGTADVTYTKLEADSLGSPSVPMSERQFTMLFPNGANVLYTNGGIPINNGQLGCPAGLIKFIIEDGGSTVGYVAKWDQAANTIRLYIQAGFTTGATGSVVAAQALAEFSTAATVASTTLRVIAAGW